jgi:3-oxoacyl-[acyl-carrier protein] reductase
MDLGLQERVALVCGGSSGLGRAIAEGLAREGARVALNGRDEAKLAVAAGEIERVHGADRAVGLAADVGVREEAEALVRRAAEWRGRLDVLVCNAGGPPAGPFAAHDAEAWASAVALNLLSTVHLCRAAVPRMREHGWGRIVCITSVAAKQPLAGLILSSTARAGVLGFAKALADEVAPDGITVNVLCPGLFATDRVRRLNEARAAQSGRPVAAIEAEGIAAIPMRRLGRPEEFAAAALLVASDAGAYITGTALSVDGGLTRSIL